MARLAFVVAVALAAAAVVAAHEDAPPAAAAPAAGARKKKVAVPSDVLQLTDANFDEALKEHAGLLVAFTAPWCGHCKQLKPAYEAAAKELKAEGLAIAQVDATANHGLSQRFNIGGFPTLKFFKSGKPTDYEGGRDKDAILAYVRRKNSPSTVDVADRADVEALLAKVDAVAVAFVESKDSPLGKHFSAAADDLESVAFAFVVGAGAAPELRASLGVAATGDAVVAVNGFDGEENVVAAGAGDLYEFAGTAAAVATWVAARSMPLVVTFSQETAPKIFRGDVRTHLLLFADAEGSEAEVAANKEFRRAAVTGRSTALFVSVPSDEERVMGYFGVTKPMLPVLVLVHMPEGGMKKYKYTGETVTSAGVSAFLAAYNAGELKPFLKSEPAPDAAANAAANVKVVTGANFDELVVNSDVDVLLEVYAPWCGHCKELAPKYEALAVALKANGIDKVVIAKMDGTANEVEVPGMQVRGFPSIFFFPAGAKSEPITFESNRDIAGFLAFLHKHATTPFELDPEDVEGGAEEDHTGHTH